MPSNWQYVIDTISKEIFDEFLEIRQSDECNVMKFSCVLAASMRRGGLVANLTPDDYFLIVENFAQLLGYYGFATNKNGG